MAQHDISLSTDADNQKTTAIPITTNSYDWITPVLVGDGTNKLLINNDGSLSFVQIGTIVKDSFRATGGNTNKTYATDMHGVSVINDGAEEITLSINGINIPIGPDESFDGNFEAFKDINITAGASTAYRAVVRM